MSVTERRWLRHALFVRGLNVHSTCAGYYDFTAPDHATAIATVEAAALQPLTCLACVALKSSGPFTVAFTVAL